MPLYTFEHPCGTQVDIMLKVTECPEEMDFICLHAGRVLHQPKCFLPFETGPLEFPCRAKKVIVVGHGGIQKGEPAWIDSNLREALQDSDGIAAGTVQPIETRKDLQTYLKNRPEIQPCG
jgi:hypothetical protein